jgi:hypothetical protein
VGAGPAATADAQCAGAVPFILFILWSLPMQRVLVTGANRGLGNSHQLLARRARSPRAVNQAGP